MRSFELLAPAGSPEALRAAVNAGADAVYIGGSAFGARAYADNPDCDALIECIHFCHLRRKKLYLTVNTLFKEKELEEELYPFLKPYYEAGLDAVIVQDPGAVSFISEHFPKLPVHLSTQAAVTMAEGTKKLKKTFKNVTRVVPARELSLEEIKQLRKDTALEIEIFVHGALCFCYSGQCLMSAMIGGRSGNRGRCAQPCRKLYDGKYLLSPKDQCLLGSIHELMAAGIDSFKIEGRMKSPEYTAGVVSVYRRYMDRYIELGDREYRKWLDNNRSVLERDINELKELYNRGGFNGGYLKDHNSSGMMSLERPNHSGLEVGEVITVRGREAVVRFTGDTNDHDVLEIRSGNTKVFEFTLGAGIQAGSTFSCITMKDQRAAVGMKVFRMRNERLLNSIRKKYIERDTKVPLRMVFEGYLGREALLSVSSGDVSAEVLGNVIEPAGKAPAEREAVERQLAKLGETDFYLEHEPKIILDPDVFVPSGMLNNMRREAVAELKEKILAGAERSAASGQNTLNAEIGRTEKEPDGDKVKDQGRETGIIYSFRDIAVLEKAIDVVGTDCDIYYNIQSFDTTTVEKLCNAVSEKCRGKEIGLWLGLPYVSRADVYSGLKQYVEDILDRYPSIGFIARSREEVYLLDEIKAKYRTDYNLYVMNRRAADYYGMEYTLPQELTLEELEPVASPEAEMIVYGYQPVMFSAQCLYKNKFDRCKGQGSDFVTITDELGHDFRAVQQCSFCTNIIYNSARLDLTGELEDIRKLGVRAVRYDFTFEDAETVKSVITTGRPADDEPSTYGLYKRGVQ